MALIGYGRVSTKDQKTDAQKAALLTAGCDPDHLFIDHGVTGKLASRPAFDACLKFLRTGDVLVITKLDRAGRSLKHLIELAGELRERGVDLKVLDQDIDTSSPAGRLFFNMVSSFAEFEADMIRERTLDGLAAARAKGRVGGRKPKLNPRQVVAIKEMHATGNHTISGLAETFKVSRPTIYAALERAAATV